MQKREELTKNEQHNPPFASCCLCPRACQVNREQGQTGFCGETAALRVASVGAHFGEEPSISGQHGSGTVFLSGCTLKCEFCQNFQISIQGLGREMRVPEVASCLEELHRNQGIHNVNFVTPDQFFPYTVDIVAELRRRGVEIPGVYNLSGYQRIEPLKGIEEYADIYLPDFKYADNELGVHLSHCQDYPAIALDAIAEMVGQKGFLDATDEEEIACKGVLVRHLILPGQVQNSLDALSMLFLEFGGGLPLSLMSQYHPVRPCGIPALHRRITLNEFQQVYEHALSLGFRHLFVQFPENRPSESPEFLPDFREQEPFAGNFLKIQREQMHD